MKTLSMRLQNTLVQFFNDEFQCLYNKGVSNNLEEHLTVGEAENLIRNMSPAEDTFTDKNCNEVCYGETELYQSLLDYTSYEREQMNVYTTGAFLKRDLLPNNKFAWTVMAFDGDTFKDGGLLDTNSIHCDNPDDLINTDE